MEDEEVVDAADTELNSFVSRLEALQKGATNVQLATVAANGGAGIIGEVTDKGLDLKSAGAIDIDNPMGHEDPLRKCFMIVAKANKNFAHFASKEAMDNPIGFLRETYVDKKGRRLYKVSNADLEAAMQIQLAAGATKEGTHFGEWMQKDGNSGAIQQAFQEGIQKGAFAAGSIDMIHKTLDSGGGAGGPLIRTDIDPFLREAYLRKFPLGDTVRRFPANGLVHTYNQRTSVGTAATISELGSLAATQDQSTYVRTANSHIAILAAQRQISLKLQYAVQQSGMSYNLSGASNLEIMGAMTAIARLNQTLVCQGNFTTGGKTLNDEEGLTDANAYDGLRIILEGGATSMTKDPAESYLRTINRAVATVVNAGGDVDDLTILLSLGAKIDVEDELINFLRFVNTVPGGGVPTNLASNGITTVTDNLTKLLAIPAASQGEGMGYYNFNAGVYEDIDVVDTNGIGLAYLGSPTPSILELPVGYNNALSNVYIPFLMNGLVVFVTTFHRKIRIPKVTV